MRAAKEIERRFTAAKRTWEAAVDMEAIASLRGEKLGAARDACVAFETALGAAKSLWLALTPQDQFEREHELPRDAIDLSRMTALLLGRACDGVEPDEDVIGRAEAIWRRAVAGKAPSSKVEVRSLTERSHRLSSIEHRALNV